MAGPLRLAFIGCGFITGVHSRHLRALGAGVVAAYASRDRARADAGTASEFGGARSYADYTAAIDDPAIDAVVIAVPPEVSPRPDAAGPGGGQARAGREARLPPHGRLRDGPRGQDAAGRVVLVGENDHYKPLAVTLRRLLAEGVIGEMVFAHFTTLAIASRRPRTGATTSRWPAATRSSRKASTGCTWPAASGPRSSRAHGYRPPASRTGPDRRAKSLMVAFQYDNRRRRLALLLARSAVAAARAAPVEALRPRGHHHLREQRRLRAGSRQGMAAA